MCRIIKTADLGNVFRDALAYEPVDGVDYSDVMEVQRTDTLKKDDVQFTYQPVEGESLQID